MMSTPASLRSDYWMLCVGIGGAFQLESLVEFAGIRIHLSLDKDSPDSRLVQSVGRVIAFPEVGGLHHRYERVA
jgi:hypothetical protein